jgi:glycosyltransferase involved in cell wall biosynthesis
VADEGACVERPLRIGIWCAYGATLEPTEGIGVFSHAVARGLAALPDVGDVQLVVHAGDEHAATATVAAGGGRIHVASLHRQPRLDRWRWKMLRRRHRRLCDRLARNPHAGRLAARRDAVERAIDRLFGRQRLFEPPGIPPRDVWLLPHVAVERPLEAPVVVVVHDMVPLHHSGVVKAADLESFRRRAQRIAARATLVGTMSRTIRDVDIVGLLGCPPEKIRVVPAATPDDLGAPVGRDALLAAVPAAGRPFLLYPAALRPYKNHARLIEALAVVRRGGHPDMQLICTGFGPLPSDLAAVAASLGISTAVHAVGSVARPVLAALYGAAAATVVPSLYEQGSFPVLEAIRCGCPAAASDIPALREAFADLAGAVPLFDPRVPPAIAAAVLGVLADREAVRRRQAEAVAALPPRSWADVAADWLAVLRAAAVSGRGV